MSAREIHHAVCVAVGITAPKIGVPLSVMSMLGAVATTVAALLGKDTRVSPLSVRLTHIMSPMSHDKAVRELSWDPRPTTETLADAARFYRTNRPSNAPIGLTHGAARRWLRRSGETAHQSRFSNRPGRLAHYRRKNARDGGPV
jgi:hypothetical protein